MDDRTIPTARLSTAQRTEAHDADTALGAPGIWMDRHEREGSFDRMVRRRPRPEPEDEAGSRGGFFRRKPRDRRPRNLAY